MDHAGFDTEITLTGPWRSPAQMLADQRVDGNTSAHDGATAASVGLTGPPIEAPTHFSQLDPLGAALCGRRWFERGCVSCHFRITEPHPSYWTRTTLTDTDTGRVAAVVSLHSGVFKESYADYPKDRLA
jgi:hypothetical protein